MVFIEPSNYIRKGLIFLNISVFLWQLYLVIRQFRKLGQTTEVPEKLRNEVKEDAFERSRQYSLSKLRLYIIDRTIVTYSVVYILYSGQMVYFFSSLRRCEVSYWTRIACEFCILSFSPYLFHSITWVYNEIVLNPKYGFKNSVFQMIKSCMAGFISQFSLVTFGTILAIFIAFFVNFAVIEDYSFIWKCVLLAFVAAYLKGFNADFLRFLWRKQEELENGDLKTSIIRLLEEYDLTVDKIYMKRTPRCLEPISFDGRHKQNLILHEKILEYKKDEALALLLKKIAVLKLKKYNIYSQYKRYKNFISITIALYVADYYPYYQALGFHRFHKNPGALGIFTFHFFVINNFHWIFCWFLYPAKTEHLYESDQLVLRKFDYKIYRSALIKKEADCFVTPIADEWFSRWIWQEPCLAERLTNLKKISLKEQ